MEQLTPFEADIAKELINIGLAKAADKLAFFTGEKMLLRSFDFGLYHLDDLEQVSSKQGDSVHVLLTQIHGDLAGLCCLLFSEQDVDKLLELTLPASVLKDEAQRAEMGEAILLEVDNIITAAVVTQFANLLPYNLFGGVPYLHRMPHEAIPDFVKMQPDTQPFMLYFRTSFLGESTEIAPEFVWLLSYRFIEGVRTLVQDQVQNAMDQLKSNND